MAKPRIFVSSTHFDLKHIRASLERFIESLGYEPILSEMGNIAYTPDQPLDESCYREVKNADVFVLIVGGRYGSEKSSGSKESTKDFYERYDSITKGEYFSAVSQDVPIYILVEKGVYADFETYLRNKDNKTINYAHVDSVNIFRLIDFIISQPRNNPIFQFERYSDIENWLKEQWAGLFRELINQISREKQITSLSSQVAELSEINKTLKKYLEAVVSKISPESSAELIQTETKRLRDVHIQTGIITNYIIKDLVHVYKIPIDDLYKRLREAATVDEFMTGVKLLIPDHAGKSLKLEKVRWDVVTRELNRAREKLGLKPWPAYQPGSIKA